MTNLEFFRIIDGQKKCKIVSEIVSNVREIMYSYLCIMKTSILNVLDNCKIVCVDTNK